MTGSSGSPLSTIIHNSSLPRNTRNLVMTFGSFLARLVSVATVVAVCKGHAIPRNVADDNLVHIPMKRYTSPDADGFAILAHDRTRAQNRMGALSARSAVDSVSIPSTFSRDFYFVDVSCGCNPLRLVGLVAYSCMFSGRHRILSSEVHDLGRHRQR